MGKDRFNNWEVSIEEGLFYGNVISLFTYNIVISIEYEDKTVPITIDGRSFVSDLKQKIKQKFEEFKTSSYFKLRYNDVLISNRNETLKYYGIEEGSAVVLKIDESDHNFIDIVVKTANKTDLELTFQITDTIE